MAMKGILPLVLACVVLSAPAVMAAPIGLGVEPGEITTKPNTIAKFNLTITNNLGLGDDFLIRTYGSRIEWKIPGDVLLDVGSGESKSTDLVFYTGSRECSHRYDIKVYSKSVPGVNESASIRISVEIPPDIMITSLEPSVEGNELSISAGLESSVSREFDITFNIKDEEGVIVSSFSVAKELDGEGSVSETVSLEGLEPGGYLLEASVGQDREEAAFTIEAVRDIVETVKKDASLLYDEVTITVCNRGNVPEDSYEVSYTLPTGDYLTGFVTEPESCTDSESGKECVFSINGLAPASSREIVFRMEYWPSYTRLIAAIAVIMAVGFIYWRRFGKPGIRKSYISKSKNTHHVIIEIKGTNKDLNNVVVRDWVSPLARVAKDSFKHAKPVIRRSEAGTELIWRLGDLLAKEERILSYKIKTIVEGHLKMPSAYLRFVDKKGGRNRVYSGHIEIK